MSDRRRKRKPERGLSVDGAAKPPPCLERRSGAAVRSTDLCQAACRDRIGCRLLAGCGQGASESGSSGFNGARPELKAAWDKAVAADKADDYVPAVLGYKQTGLCSSLN